MYTLAATFPRSIPFSFLNCRLICTTKPAMTYLIENVEQVNTCPNLDFDLDDLGDLPHDYSEEWSMVLWVNIPWEINERKGGL